MLESRDDLTRTFAAILGRLERLPAGSGAACAGSLLVTSAMAVMNGALESLEQAQPAPALPPPKARARGRLRRVK